MEQNYFVVSAALLGRNTLDAEVASLLSNVGVKLPEIAEFRHVQIDAAGITLFFEVRNGDALLSSVHLTVEGYAQELPFDLSALDDRETVSTKLGPPMASDSTNPVDYWPYGDFTTLSVQYDGNSKSSVITAIGAYVAE